MKDSILDGIEILEPRPVTAFIVPVRFNDTMSRLNVKVEIEDGSTQVTMLDSGETWHEGTPENIQSLPEYARRVVRETIEASIKKAAYEKLKGRGA